MLGKEVTAGLSERSPGLTVFTTKLVEQDVAERAGVARYRGCRWVESQIACLAFRLRYDDRTHAGK
jgi:hypothetical protein